MAEIFKIVQCPRCEGKGKIRNQMMFNAQTYRGYTECDRCKGRGTVGVKGKRKGGGSG